MLSLITKSLLSTSIKIPHPYQLGFTHKMDIFFFSPCGKQFLQKFVIVHKELYVSEFTHLHTIYCFNYLPEKDLH